MKAPKWQVLLVAIVGMFAAYCLLNTLTPESAYGFDASFDAFTKTTETQGFVSNVSKTAVSAGAKRMYLRIQNWSTNAMYIRLSTNAATANNGIRLNTAGSEGDVFESRQPTIYRGAVTILSASADSNIFTVITSP